MSARLLIQEGVLLPEVPKDGMFLSDEIVSHALPEVAMDSDEILSSMMHQTREQVILFFDDLERKVLALRSLKDDPLFLEKTVLVENLNDILDGLRKSVLDSGISWEDEGGLVFISLIVNQRVLDCLNKFEVIVRGFGKLDLLFEESRKSLQGLSDLLNENVSLIESYSGVSELTQDDKRKIAQAEGVVRNRGQRIETREKRNIELKKYFGKMFSEGTANIDELWQNFSEFANFLQEKNWLSGPKAKDEFLRGRNLSSVFDLVVQLVEKNQLGEGEIDYRKYIELIDDVLDESDGVDFVIDRKFGVIALVLLAMLSGVMLAKRYLFMMKAEDYSDNMPIVKVPEIDESVLSYEIDENTTPYLYFLTMENNVRLFLMHYFSMNVKAFEVFAKMGAGKDDFNFVNKYDGKNVRTDFLIENFNEKILSRELVYVEDSFGNIVQGRRVVVSRSCDVKFSVFEPINMQNTFSVNYITWYLE
ncbi:MAG: hypothetical protein RBS56_02895 [Candidatus Gracilibacteria bacterium]|jgi:hypothetical protein|nr:hypothetical protein [Candidatus Gracilibacteria bacterium]